MKNDKFSIPLTVRVSDLNYGNHVGYQNYFSYFQEARMAYLTRLGYSELDIEGYGMIVGEANCKYKQELFLNDRIQVACRTKSIKGKRFVMEYRISRDDHICAEGFTHNYCYDDQAKTIARLPAAFVQAVSAFEGWEPF